MSTNTPTVQTVLGPADPSQLGIVSMEDYLFFDGVSEGAFYRSQISSHPYPIHVQDPVTLHNVGMLYRNYVLSEDATRPAEAAVLEREIHEFQHAGGGTLLDPGYIRGLRHSYRRLHRLLCGPELARPMAYIQRLRSPRQISAGTNKRD